MCMAGRFIAAGTKVLVKKRKEKKGKREKGA